MRVEEILKKPYARMVVPDGTSGFVAEIVEFSGCYAVGATAADALSELESVAADWIKAARSQGQEIPEPLDTAGYSGKLVLRMPRSIHQKAALWAEREHVSLNQFIVTCVSEHIGMKAAFQTQVANINYFHLISQFISAPSFSLSSGITLGQQSTDMMVNFKSTLGQIPVAGGSTNYVVRGL